ncbi:hypothetical protein ASO20_00780 [Mycoplasma sp. (ex Biomphalaria glabrata)]|uniref:Cof-type HAD-IIB family hydrolase n=1 Tax=Mycoplasma sp. (ex Biomphalaria glabrata) TaxID=1749074 RepID=UPI00073A9721|nr:Cof-type HAD-IIB family hydrolase [Mycoplasma sp. (ex Biomphalaria glabrata)]ALV23211.1 hypothetical protein ASO20_00780 [Mycoplasma sp. (ex Biomphalaria glabrata)]
MDKSKPWLICIDLDGTTIKSDGFSISHANKLAIKKAKELGHIICIVSGRPPRSVIDIYNSLELNTLISSYNGAFIYDPKNNDNVIASIGIDAKVVYEIINNPLIKEKSKAILLEKDNVPYLNTISHELFEQCQLYNSLLIVDDLNNALKDCKNINACLIETFNNVEFEKYSQVLDKYKNEIIYREWPKPGLKSVVIDITAPKAHKGNAAEILASFYDIPRERTIAFGDGSNDYEIISWVKHGVKMKNGNKTLDVVCNDVTDYTNNDGGVGKYLNKFFDLKIEF